MIDYQKVLDDLEARRSTIVADLDASIRTVKQILKANGQEQQLRPAQDGETNQTKLVFDFLVKEAPRPKTAKDIVEGTGLPPKAVPSILNRLYKGKKIERVSRGKFRGKAQSHEAAA